MRHTQAERNEYYHYEDLLPDSRSEFRSMLTAIDDIKKINTLQRGNSASLVGTESVAQAQDLARETLSLLRERDQATKVARTAGVKPLPSSLDETIQQAKDAILQLKVKLVELSNSETASPDALTASLENMKAVLNSIDEVQQLKH